jgi:pre-mRNA 3'-end-processing factor FIP1
MDIDDDDDFYAPAESTPSGNEQQDQQFLTHTELKPRHPEEDLEEGEEEDEGEEDGSDSVELYV